MNKEIKKEINQICDILEIYCNEILELKKSNTNPENEEVKKIVLDNNRKTVEAIKGLEEKIDNTNSRIKTLEQKPEPVIDVPMFDPEPINQEIEHIKEVGNKNNEYHKNLVFEARNEFKQKLEELAIKQQALVNILTKEYGEKLGSGIKGEEWKLKAQVHKDLKRL